MTKKKKSNKEAYKKAYKEIWKDERNEAEERQKKVIKDFKYKVFDYSELEIMLNNIKADKPLLDAARRLGIAQADSDYDNVTHLINWIKENHKMKEKI